MARWANLSRPWGMLLTEQELSSFSCSFSCPSQSPRLLYTRTFLMFFRFLFEFRISHRRHFIRRDPAHTTGPWTKHLSFSLPFFLSSSYPLSHTHAHHTFFSSLTFWLTLFFRLCTITGSPLPSSLRPKKARTPDVALVATSSCISFF